MNLKEFPLHIVMVLDVKVLRVHECESGVHFPLNKRKKNQ